MGRGKEVEEPKRRRAAMVMNAWLCIESGSRLCGSLILDSKSYRLLTLLLGEDDRAHYPFRATLLGGFITQLYLIPKIMAEGFVCNGIDLMHVSTRLAGGGQLEN